MRYQGPYRCAPCSFESPVQVSCPRCGGPTRDRGGFAPPSPRRFDPRLLTSPRARGLAVGLATLWITVALGLALALVNRGGRAVGQVAGDPMVLAGLLALWTALVPIGLFLARRVRALRRRGWLAAQRARLAAATAAAGEPTPIAQAPDDGVARIRGTVRVLSPAVEGTTLAAEHGEDDVRTGGRYAIVDASGRALVDDDCFELWTADGGVATVTVLDGATVEVIGRGRWAPGGDVGVDAGYRDRRVYRLDGRPDAPLHVRLQP